MVQIVPTEQVVRPYWSDLDFGRYFGNANFFKIGYNKLEDMSKLPTYAVILAILAIGNTYAPVQQPADTNHAPVTNAIDRGRSRTPPIDAEPSTHHKNEKSQFPLVAAHSPTETTAREGDSESESMEKERVFVTVDNFLTADMLEFGSQQKYMRHYMDYLHQGSLVLHSV